MEGERSVLAEANSGTSSPNYAPVPVLSSRFLPPLPPQFKRLPAPEPRAEGFLPAPAPIPLAYARPAARLGNLVAPNFQAQHPANEPRRAAEEPGHGLPDPGMEERRLNETRGREEELMRSVPPSPRPVGPAVAAPLRPPVAGVRPPPVAPGRAFVAVPHPAAPMRPVGEVR